MPAPLDPAKRQAIEQAIRDGAGHRSRNGIARQFGVAASTVSRIATDAGIEDAFDRSNTVNATRAKAVDLSAARLALQERWVAKANEALDRSEKPCVVYAFGGRENTFESWEFELPPASEYRSFVTAAAVATDKLVALAKYDAGGEEADDAKSMLTALSAGLATLYTAQQLDQPDAA